MFFQYFCQYFGWLWTSRIEQDLREDLMNKILNYNYQEFESYKKDEYLSVFTNDVQAISNQYFFKSQRSGEIESYADHLWHLYGLFFEYLDCVSHCGGFFTDFTDTAANQSSAIRGSVDIYESLRYSDQCGSGCLVRFCLNKPANPISWIISKRKPGQCKS